MTPKDIDTPDPSLLSDEEFVALIEKEVKENGLASHDELSQQKLWKRLETSIQAQKPEARIKLNY